MHVSANFCASQNTAINKEFDKCKKMYLYIFSKRAIFLLLCTMRLIMRIDASFQPLLKHWNRLGNQTTGGSALCRSTRWPPGVSVSSPVFDCNFQISLQTPVVAEWEMLHPWADPSQSLTYTKLSSANQSTTQRINRATQMLTPRGAAIHNLQLTVPPASVRREDVWKIYTFEVWVVMILLGIYRLSL